MKVRNEIPLVTDRPRIVWQYRCEFMSRDSDLAQFGAEGWECYSVVPAGADMCMFYFRRRA